MKKIIICVVSIWISLITTLLFFESLSWYHFGDIPTTNVAIRFSICFLLSVLLVYWLNKKIVARISRIENSKNHSFIFCILLLFMGFYSFLSWNWLTKNNENFIVNYPFTIVTSELEYTNEPYLYTIWNDQNIYSNLSSIKVKKGDDLIELKDYLKENPNTIETMMKYLELKEQYRDGGTKLYRDTGGSYLSFTNEGLTMIQCNKTTSEETNTDIYITLYGTEYKSPICENTRLLRINDILYYDTKKENNFLGRCGTGMEKISSTVLPNEIPMKNYESNFGKDYEFMSGKNNTIEVFIEGKWQVFEPREYFKS